MNSFTNTVLTLMLGWLRTLLNAARDFVSSDSSAAFFNFFRNNWKIIFLVLCVGGFVLDKIVYLIRWRPSPIWIRRRARCRIARPAPGEAYDLPEYDDDLPVIPTDDYAQPDGMGYQNAAPTMQYQRQPMRAERPAYIPEPEYPIYSTPRYAPEATQPMPAVQAPLYRDEPEPKEPFAPPAARQQRFMFDMAPSFGSAQSEPAYSYHQEAAPTFAPPQYAEAARSGNTYAPPAYGPGTEPYADAYEDGYPEAAQYPLQPPTPQFRPFSDREADAYPQAAPSKLGAVAKKAHDLLNPDEAYESLSYQDLQSTVDVTKAFHSPVYPEKKPEGDA